MSLTSAEHDAAAAAAAATATANAFAAADQLHAQCRDEDAVALLLSHFGEDGSSSSDVMYRLGRSHYHIAEELDEHGKEKEAKKVYLTAFKECEQALALDPNSPDAHCWFGITIAGTVKHAGPKENIAKAYEVRDCFKKAIELDPTHVFGLHCLGAWCYEVSQIGWLARQAATVLFGAPPRSSLDEARLLLEQADKFLQLPCDGRPRRYLLHTYGYLSLTLYRLEEFELSLRWMDAIESIHAHTRKEQAFKAKVLEKRAKAVRR